MMTMTRSALLCSLFSLFAVLGGVTPAQAADPAPRVRVKATGQAPADLPNAREAAIEDALRRCVEAGGGVQLASITESEDFTLVSDVIYTRTAGYVQRYEVLQENPNQAGLYTVRVSAIVTTGDLNTDIAAFKALLQRKGNPRILLVGSANGEPFDFRLTAQLQGQLERKGLRVIDADVLNEQQRKAAERAAKADGDTKRAALIAQQVGADVLAIVNVDGEKLPAQTVYGQTSYPIDAVGIVKLIRADTAEVLGSVVKEDQVSGPTEAKAVRNATTAVTSSAMKDAVRRIGSHWLEEVDQRGGQEILIVMHRYAFERTSKLVGRLRQVQGVKAVVIDRTDAEGTGQLRVTTNASAADVAAVLIKLDPTVKVVSSSANRVEIK